MSKPDYTEFDTALLDLIANGCNTLMKLDSRSSGLLDLAQPFCVEGPRGESPPPEWRIIDRRLQALRKRGSLRFDGKVWVRLDRSGDPL